MRRGQALALAAAALMILPTEGAAQKRGPSAFIQGPIEAGLRAGRDFENHAWSLGGQVRLPIRENIELRPSGDAFFPGTERPAGRPTATPPSASVRARRSTGEAGSPSFT